MIQTRNASILAFQNEMEDAFRLDCNKEDIKSDKDAKKLFAYIRKSRRKVNRIDRLTKWILCDKKSIYDKLMWI